MSFTVDFVTNGGTAIEQKTVGDGALLKEVEVSTQRKGYTLDGWYRNKNL